MGTKISIIAFFLLLVQINLMAQVTKTVGNTGADYVTLKAAFDAINAGTITGNIELQVIANTTESAVAILYHSGYDQAGGLSNYSSVLIYPTSAGLSISGGLMTSIISLNGADNVTIDGRVNQTGITPSLTIENTWNGSGYLAIYFGNSAESNTIRYCNIKAANNLTTSGIIHFAVSTTGVGNGNSNNTIEYNNISGIAGGRSANAIYSSGTDGRLNSNNTISNNNIFDHHLLSTSSKGIHIFEYSTNFIISGNSFYETTSLAFTGTTVTLQSIYVANHTGNGYVTITGNYFGGKAPQCGGDKLTLTDDGTAKSISYNPIWINSTGMTTQSHITNNTIANIEIKRTTNGNPFKGIYSQSGGSASTQSNIGNVTGNIIGAATGNGSITINTNHTGTSQQNIYGLQIGLRNTGTATHHISNNVIGSFTLSGTISNRPYFIGIETTGGFAGTNAFIENNLIGSLTTANSINNSTTHTGSGQSVVGFQTTSAGLAINYFIRNNTIANMNNNTIGTVALNRLHGIRASGTLVKYEISGNTIRNLTCSTNNTDNQGTTALVGIHLSTATGTGGQNVFNNTIHDLVNTSTTPGAHVNVTGIYFQGPTAASTSNIYNNFIHSLRNNSGNTSNSSTIIGIELNNMSTTGDGNSVVRNVYNNVVSLGTDIASTPNIYGIYELGSALRTNNFYFNTVYIGGTASGHGNSFPIACFRIDASGPGSVKNIRNNIMMNARTATGASNDFVCMALLGDLGATGATTINFNNYWFAGEGTAFGYTPFSVKATFAAWKIDLDLRAGISGKDSNSKNVDPCFTLTLDVGGTDPNDFKSTNNALKGAGVTITGFATDYGGYTRPDPPSLGAIENENPLPVKLSSFTSSVKNSDVKLNWVTENEINNSGFEIERKSFGANEWKKVAFVEGRGNTNSPTTYKYEDKKLNSGKYNYRLRQIDYNGNFEYFVLDGKVEVGIPWKFDLSQNYPNPFNPTTKIDFELPADGKVMLLIYDISGREIKTLLNETKQAGYYTVEFNGNNLASGVYFYRLITENNKFVMTKKMVLIK